MIVFLIAIEQKINKRLFCFFFFFFFFFFMIHFLFEDLRDCLIVDVSNLFLFFFLIHSAPKSSIVSHRNVKFTAISFTCSTKC